MTVVILQVVYMLTIDSAIHRVTFQVDFYMFTNRLRSFNNLQKYTSCTAKSQIIRKGSCYKVTQ